MGLESSAARRQGEGEKPGMDGLVRGGLFSGDRGNPHKQKS